MPQPRRILTALGALLLAPGCGGPSSAISYLSISLTGVAPWIAMDQTPVFTATVSGSTDTKVLWVLQEGSVAGTIDADGTYHPGATPGTYHVEAMAHANVGTTITDAFQLIEPAAIAAFQASATQVAPGTPVQLTFQFTGTGSIGGVGPVTSGLPVTVTPQVTTTYTLTVTNLAGEKLAATQTVSVS